MLHLHQIGAYLKSRPDARSKLFIATKFAVSMSPTLGMTINSTPEYALEAMEKSLKRLGVDHVDLFYWYVA
jgi:aryl-alcohol dehydrogenase-like predicted oxidoreductase